MKTVRRKLEVASKALAVLVVLTVGCSSGGGSGLSPVSYPDPAAPCPAGRTGWTLEVLDRRATREGSEGVVTLISESIRQSFPGCRWETEAAPDLGVIRVEVHRFQSIPSGSTWDAAAEWTVTASDPAGATLTEFQADEEVERPNYRGSNNEKESLREVLDRAMRRTLAGLRVVSSAEGDVPGRGRGPSRSSAAGMAVGR
jgi:hypothetical protein